MSNHQDRRMSDATQKLGSVDLDSRSGRGRVAPHPRGVGLRTGPVGAGEFGYPGERRAGRNGDDPAARLRGVHLRGADADGDRTHRRGNGGTASVPEDRRSVVNAVRNVIGGRIATSTPPPKLTQNNVLYSSLS